MTKQIIAAGGDAVTDIPFHYYMLAQSSSEKPKVCLLPTASGDNEDLIRTFYGIMRRHHCELDYLPLFRNKEKNIREFILNQDIILVAGGQSKSMMGVWKEWGVHEYLMEAYDNGTIMAGGSAGSVCWFDECITDSFAGKLAPMPALGFLTYSNCPHYRSDERRAAYKTAILEKRIKPGYAISDDAALHFVDGKLFRGICSEANASSFYVDIDLNGKEPKIRSERIPTSWLGSRAVQDELIWPAPAFKYMIAEQEAEDKKAAEEEQEASRQG